MTPVTPTISFQCNWIKSVLSGWAKKEGGVAVIAHDLSSMWEIAFRTSQVPRCIITYAGEDIRGDFSIAAETSRVDRHFVVLVTRGRGATADRGVTLTEQYQNARPFYDLLEEARDLIRVLQFDPSVVEAYGQNPVDYRGIKPALPEDVPMDAYMIEFSIGTQLGVPQFNDNVTVPPSAPFNLTAISSSGARLDWVLDSFDADSTAVWRSTDSGSTYMPYDSVNGADIVTYTDIGVSVGNTYVYKVARSNVAGSSSYSNAAGLTF